MKHTDILLGITSIPSFAQNTANKPKGLITSRAMVVSAHEEASRIGAEIMKKGGNAFDAMIATELALVVIYPYASNISGGFMVYRKANGEVGSLDYRERVAIATTKNMFLDKDGNIIKKRSTEATFAIGVPGTIAGVFAIHKKLGSLPMSVILKPIIDLAEKGVIVTKKQEQQLNNNRSAITETNGKNTLFAYTYKENDIIKYPALADTFKRIQKNGRDEFYKGKTAKVLINGFKKNSGITMRDLSEYEVKWGKPLAYNYKNLRIYSLFPPNRNRVYLDQILKLIEHFDLENMGSNSSQAISEIEEKETKLTGNKNVLFCESYYANTPRDHLHTDNYLKHKTLICNSIKTSLSSDENHRELKKEENKETTHYSIVDELGNAIAATTLNNSYGPKYYCDELGFFLNNDVDVFNIKHEAKSITSQKKLLSCITPVIVEKNGNLFMVVGNPEGSTIITSVLQTIVNIHEHHLNILEGKNTSQPRHTLLPSDVSFESETLDLEALEYLKLKNYIIKEKTKPEIGKIDPIYILSNKSPEDENDLIKEDSAAGF